MINGKMMYALDRLHDAIDDQHAHHAPRAMRRGGEQDGDHGTPPPARL